MASASIIGDGELKTLSLEPSSANPIVSCFTSESRWAASVSYGARPRSAHSSASKALSPRADAVHWNNLSIGEGRLRRWSGASLKRIWELEMAHRRVAAYARASKVPGRTALRAASYLFDAPQVISALEDSDAARLPMIELRTILVNELVRSARRLEALTPSAGVADHLHSVGSTIRNSTRHPS